MKTNELIKTARRKVGAAFQARRHPARLIEHPYRGKVHRFECYRNSDVLVPIVPDLTSDTIANAIRAGTYEAHEAALLGGLIQHGEVILEIGAGCGLISTICAKNPYTSVVECVEANPNLIDMIKMTHSLNSVKVAVHNEVLAKSDGETDFFVHPDFWASGTHSFLGTSIKVRTTSFQKRLNELRPTMLVVDIEGGEVEIFDDVDLTGVRKIMVELHQPTIGRRGMKKVFDVLSKQNFHYDMWHSTYSVVTFSHVDRY
jgi:FkbM family methyltransferase